jgi:hypothetical protein
VLSTAALGSLLYRAASYVIANGVPTLDALTEWKFALNSATDLPTTPADLASVFIANVCPKFFSL